LYEALSVTQKAGFAELILESRELYLTAVVVKGGWWSLVIRPSFRPGLPMLVLTIVILDAY
jgi:hypothetical protein